MWTIKHLGPVFGQSDEPYCHKDLYENEQSNLSKSKCYEKLINQRATTDTAIGP